MDIMKVLKNYISQGLSPEAIVTKMVKRYKNKQIII